MGKAWFTDYPHISIEFENLKIVDKIDERKPFTVIIEPKKEYIENLIVGFDEIPSKSIVEKNYEHLKKEYLCIKNEKYNVIEKLNQEDMLQSKVEYIPNWISMRTGKDNSVELKLDWKPNDWWVFNKSAEERSEEYDCIGFEPHEDFEIKPLNLKDKKGDLIDTVTITCKNNNKNPAMLKIVVDDNKIVGAVNVFYPKLKKVNIEWAIIGFNPEEIENLKLKYKKSILQNYFRKAFHTTLIDVKILNSSPHEINITDLKLNGLPIGANDKVNKDKDISGFINRIYNSIQNKKQVKGSEKHQQNFATYLYHLGKEIDTKLENENDYKIILYLTNLKCTNSQGSVNGFSLTGYGISIMTLGNNEIYPSTEIPHEVMHAIALSHPFEIDSGYEIEKGYTNNYMDYKKGNNKTTYKWQWEKLHKSKFTYEK